MSLEYIAGFFDGEGSIYLHHDRPQIVIYQAKQNNHVLYCMKKFLNNHHGIAAHINHDLKPRCDTFKPTLMSVLQIRDVESAILFLKIIYPFLYIKRAKIDEIFKTVNGRTYNTRKQINIRLESAQKDYFNGMSAVAAAKKNSVSWKCLKNHFLRNDIVVRNASSSKKLWWKNLPDIKKQKIYDALDRGRHSETRRHKVTSPHAS